MVFSFLQASEESDLPSENSSSGSDSENSVAKNLDTTSEAESNSVTDILGSDPTASPHPGPIIHEQITNRWSTFTKKGIDKADRKELLQKYPLISNIPSLKPPVLNPEIEGCLSETVLKQDSFLLKIQEQLATAISTVAIPMNTFFCNPHKDTKLHLTHLADATKLLTDLHHTLSSHRRYEISGLLDTNIKKTIMDRPIDEWLFGTDLTTNIKSSQEMKKASANLKAKRFKNRYHQSAPGSNSREASTSFLPKRPPLKPQIQKNREGGNNKRREDKPRFFGHPSAFKRQHEQRRQEFRKKYMT